MNPTSVYYTHHKSSINHTNSKLDTLCIFSHTVPSRRVGGLSQLWNNTRKMSFSQGQNVTLPSSKTEPRVDNLAVANLRSYPLSCTAACLDYSVTCFSPSTQHRYSQHGHRTTTTLLLLFCAYSVINCLSVQ